MRLSRGCYWKWNRDNARRCGPTNQGTDTMSDAPRNGNGNGNGNGIPKVPNAWVNWATWAMTKFGVATVALVWLCWAVVMPLRDGYLDTMREISLAVKEIKTCELSQVEREAAQAIKQERHFEACAREHLETLKGIEKNGTILADQREVLKTNQDIHKVNQASIEKTLEILNKMLATRPDKSSSGG
jgi:hypothetical protein